MSYEAFTDEKTNKMYRLLIFTGIVIISLNLRPGMTSVGPLIGTIRDDIGLANWSAGLLTSLPLLAFSIMSPIVPMLSNRYTNERVIIGGLVTLIRAAEHTSELQSRLAL